VSRPERRDLRRDLLAAGERVFASAGFAGSSVDDVIRAAETSRATFYRYFPSKDALFEELSRECFGEMRDVVRGFALIRPGAIGAEPGPEAEPDRVPDSTRARLEELLGRYRVLHDRHQGVIRAWAERSGPVDSPMRAEGRRALGALISEMAGAGGEAGQRDVRAALLFTLVERSSAYVTSRTSKVRPDRLDSSLATMIQRAYFGA
jgi:AcrR family transcriptional regulator